MEERERMSLANIARGAVNESFEVELQRVLENIMDPNTSPKTARKITISLEIKPNMDRMQAMISCSAKSTLANADPVETMVVINKNKSGEIVAQELLTQAYGQLEITEDGRFKEPGTRINFKKVSEAK